MTRSLRTVIALLVATALAACAAPRGANVVGTGTVTSISEVSEASQGAGIAGSVGGAVAGGLLGSLFGGGTGRTVATGVGAAVGSGVGGQAGAQAGAVTAWDVHIRFDDGIDRTVRVYQMPGLRPGQKVRANNGVVTPL